MWHRRYLWIGLLFFVLPYPSIQAQGEYLSLETIQNDRDLIPRSPGRIQWWQSGNAYTLIKRNAQQEQELVRVDCETGATTVLLNAAQLTPAGADQPLFVSDYTFSPDGSQCMIFTHTVRVWRANTRGDYWIYDLQRQRLHQLGKGLPASSLMFAKWNPDATQVAYVSGHNLYVEHLGSGEIRQLTRDGSEDLINGTFDWAYEEEFFCQDGFRWSPDGSKIAFWQIDASEIPDFLMINNTDSLYSFVKPVEYPKVGTQPSAARIGIIELASGNHTWLPIPGEPQQHYLPRGQWLDGHRFLVQQLNRNQNDLQWWLYEHQTGAGIYLYREQSEDAWVDVNLFDLTVPWEMDDLPVLEAGKKLLRLSDKAGWRHLYAIDLEAGGSEEDLTPGAYDLARWYDFVPGKGGAYINASPDNAAQRYLYRVDWGEAPVRLTPDAFPGVNNYQISPNGRYAIHTHENAETPRSFHLIRLPDHSRIRTLEDNQVMKARLASLARPKVEFFQVEIEDGVSLDGRMLLPPDFDPSLRYPVLFNLYGEPAGQTVIDRLDRPWHWMLAQQGYIVMTLDNRGTAGIKGRDWRKSIYKKVGVLNSRDQALATKKIIEWDYVDPARIAVWGWSGGGSMTLNLLFRYPELYSTGMSVAPVANQLYYNSIYQERYMGLPQEDLAPFIEGSPITYAHQLRGNLLLVHGTADDNVHYQNAEVLINELVKHNKLFQVMPYPNRSHSINEGEGTTRHLFHMMTDYLQQHVEPGGKAVEKKALEVKGKKG